MFLQCIPIYCKHRFYFISLDNHREFIPMLSPVKQSRNQNQWFNFNLQTSPTKVWRVVAFNIGSHSTLKKQQQQRNKKRKQGQSCHIQPAAECTDCTKVWHLFWLCSSQATSHVCHFTPTWHNNNSETNFPINKLTRENVNDECLIVPQVMETYKRLMEGSETPVNCKNCTSQIMPRTPYVVTANALPWSSLPKVDREAFQNRCIIYHIKACPGLRKYKSNIHPGVWAFEHHFHYNTDVEKSAPDSSDSNSDSTSDSPDSDCHSPTSSSSKSSQSTQSEPPPTINHNCNCDQATIYSALDTEKEVVLNDKGYQFISLSYKPTPTPWHKVNHKPPDERTIDADRVRIRNAKRKLSY